MEKKPETICPPQEKPEHKNIEPLATPQCLSKPQKPKSNKAVSLWSHLFGGSGKTGKSSSQTTLPSATDDRKQHKADNSQNLHGALAKYLNLENKVEKQNEKDNIVIKITECSRRDINEQDGEGNTPLHLAVATQDLVIIAAIMAKKPKLELINHLGRTALHEAVARGNAEILPLLLPAQDNPDLHANSARTCFLTQPDKSGFTPMGIALNQDNPAMIKTLLKLGLNPVEPVKEKTSALHYAVYISAVNCFSELLQHDNLPTIDPHNNLERLTPLNLASAFGYEKFLDIIIKHPRFDAEKYCNFQDVRGYTPLASAVSLGNLICIKKHIEAGARTDMLDNKGRTLIAIACEDLKSYKKTKDVVTDIVKTIIEYGADPKVLIDGGQSCLHLVAKTGDNVDLFQLLVNKGLDPLLQDAVGWTPLHYAADNASAGIARLLLKEGVSANITDQKGLLPLHLACLKHNDVVEQKDYNATIRCLLTKTDNPNTLSTTGFSPLTFACNRGRTDNVQSMLSPETLHKVNLNILDINKQTPVMHSILAINEGRGNKDDHLDIMAKLLHSGADPNIRFPEGSTLLNQCIAAGEPAIKTLLKHAKEIDVNPCSSYREQPLVKACLKLTEPFDAVKALLAMKADPNPGTLIKSNLKSSAPNTLHALFSRQATVKSPIERWKVAKLLIEHGVNPYQASKDYSDSTPFHMAIRLDGADGDLAIRILELTPPSKEQMEQRQDFCLTPAQLAGNMGNFLLSTMINNVLSKNVYPVSSVRSAARLESKPDY